MSQAEALLQSMTEDVHTHEHTVIDHDSYFVIDPDSRVIENASQTENTVMQYDHNSEKFTFELPRHIEGHDMTLCNRVRVHFNNIELDEFGIPVAENADVAELYDLAVCPDDSDKVRCSWSIARQATQLAGTLSFLVQFECINDAGISVYEWHTDIYTDAVVKKGRNNAEQAVIEYSNVLEQWYQRIFGAGDSVIAAVAAEGDRQKEAIARKAEETLATIPEDYTTTHNMAEEALRRKADAIELDTEGESISIDDSSDTHLLGLKLYGKTVQDGVPTPEAPVDMVSVENPVVTIRGKNLIPFPYTDTTVTKNGITFTVNDDGSIRVSGTATNVSVFTVFQGSLPLNDVFTLSGVTNDVSPSTHYMQPYVDGVFKDAQINGGRTYEINGNLTQISLYVKNGETVNCTIHPQLEIGDHATEYEPSKPIHSLTINHTLRGIPVTSGGNYTDVNGQQWICDEIDFERGVYVQRTKKFVLSELNPDTWYTWGVSKNTDGVTGFYHYFTEPVLLDFVLCNIGLYGAQTWGGVKPGVGASANSKYLTLSLRNEILADTSSDEKAIESLKTLLADTNVTMLAAIEPIETPLTEEEIAYYKKLKTYYHNTMILNDSRAMMKVKYNADTKQYILDAVRTGLVSPEEVQNAVNEYLKDNPVDAGLKLTLGIVELLADRWISKNENLHSQVVTIEGVTPYSQVDLTPSVEQLVAFYEKDLTFVTENEEGVVTVYAIGQKPTNDYSIQATIKEVAV
jgi:hypothetical protein